MMRAPFILGDLFIDTGEEQKPTTLADALDRSIVKLNHAELHKGATVLLDVEDVRELCRAAYRESVRASKGAD